MEKPEYQEKLKYNLKVMYTRNNIFLDRFDSNDSLRNSILKFIVFDSGVSAEKNYVYKVIKIISNWINLVGKKDKNICKFDIEIYTFSDNRKNSLENLRNKALQEIEKNKFLWRNSLL